jgi:hypothetical protein
MYESAEMEFLNANAGEIADAFDKRLRLIRQITARMKGPGIGFEERVICLSMIQELSHGLEESARELYQISAPASLALR